MITRPTGFTGIDALRLDPRRATALVLAALLLASLLMVASGCYRRTVREQGIGAGHNHDRVYQPNAPDADEPLLPWFGNDNDDDNRR